MALQTVAGHRVGEDVDDLKAWLRELTGGPGITHTLAAACHDPEHGEAAGWFYVESDPTAGVARRRCVRCARSEPVLDSEERWTYPPMWSCPGCQNSLAEVAFGVHADGDADARVTWLVMAVRCVACGRMSGVTDMNVENLTLVEAAARI